MLGGELKIAGNEIETLLKKMWKRNRMNPTGT